MSNLEKRISDLQEDIQYYARIIDAINPDNIISDAKSIFQDDRYEDLKAYFNSEKLINALLKHDVVLYTSPHFNFYKEHKVKKTDNIIEFLESYLKAIKKWAEYEVEALFDFYQFNPEESRNWIYDIIQQIGEKTKHEVLESYFENPIDSCSWVEKIREVWEIEVGNKKWKVEVIKTIGGYIEREIDKMEIICELVRL
ncbi:MAG TPA: hypothetical protein ENF41_00650 [Candidatus Bathyarchaeota archaeon]|nr:hypothetical protein [Candidatus Bathyarchaeota archaeon]